MILVTGANGFLGSHLIQLLSGHNIHVRATYRSALPEALKNIPNVTWQQCDLLDVDAIEACMQNITHVYHCANTVSFSNADAQMLMHNNVEATAKVVNACIDNKVQKLVFVSSVGAIARENNNKLISEKTPWLQNNLTSVYALSKYKAEMEVWRGSAEGLNVCIVCPSIILGEGNYNTGSCAIFKTVAQQFPFYTSGVNAWVDVLDVAKSMMLLMQSKITNERFIISAGNYSYKNVFTLIAQSLNVKPPTILANAFLSNLAWRYYAIKTFFTGKQSVLTRETATTAQSVYEYDNSKFLNAFPEFRYQKIEDTIARVSKNFVMINSKK